MSIPLSSHYYCEFDVGTKKKITAGKREQNVLSVKSTEAIVWFTWYLMNCHKMDPMGEVLGSMMAAENLVAGRGVLIYST